MVDLFLNLCFEILHIQGAGFCINGHIFNHNAPVSQLQPGGSIAIMIHPGDKDFITVFHSPYQRLGQ